MDQDRKPDARGILTLPSLEQLESAVLHRARMEWLASQLIRKSFPITIPKPGESIAFPKIADLTPGG